ncbi:hypothetical protein ACWEV4_35320, partial [Streptomyces sp. NPDC003860]
RAGGPPARLLTTPRPTARNRTAPPPRTPRCITDVTVRLLHGTELSGVPPHQRSARVLDVLAQAQAAVAHPPRTPDHHETQVLT